MDYFKIHFLNTVWSDSILLERNGKWGFVDTASGFYYDMIKDYLNKHNIKHLDFIILTHFHSDHYTNISKIINDYEVDTLYIKSYSAHEGSTASGYASNEEYLAHEKIKYEEILEASKKCKKMIKLDDCPSPYYIDFDEVKLELFNTTNHLIKLWEDPDSPYYHTNKFSENANSVPIFIKYNNHTVFLGADCIDHESSVPEFNQLARRIVKKIYEEHNINHIDLYKSCHHGGSGTNGLELLQLINADFCVITNTDRWLDNWSTRDNLKLANPNVEILQTDYYQYVFDLDKEKLEYEKIENVSPFITLHMN